MITKEDLIKFETDIKECFLRGEIRTPVHLVGGNEDQLIGVFKDILPDDWVFSTYRSHYHSLLKGVPAEHLKRDILTGKSMHINSREHRFFTSSIVGGCLPIAVGVAMAIQRKGLSDWVWVFVGDMSAETGSFSECYRYASWHNLPISFPIEDNGFSVNTPTMESWGRDIPAPDYVRKGNLIGKERIKYDRTYPHQGVGQWVDFK